MKTLKHGVHSQTTCQVEEITEGINRQDFDGQQCRIRLLNRTRQSINRRMKSNIIEDFPKNSPATKNDFTFSFGFRAVSHERKRFILSDRKCSSPSLKDKKNNHESQRKQSQGYDLLVKNNNEQKIKAKKFLLHHQVRKQKLSLQERKYQKYREKKEKAEAATLYLNKRKKQNFRNPFRQNYLDKIEKDVITKEKIKQILLENNFTHGKISNF